MGNFEKLVVLTVLFLSAIVLAVTLNNGSVGEEEDGSGGDPALDARRILEEEEARRSDASLLAEAGSDLAEGGLGSEVPPAATGTEAGSRGTESSSTPAPGGPLLLDSGVRPEGGAPIEAGARRSPYGDDSIVLRPGLREASVPGVLLYDLEGSSTWEQVAVDLYGDARHAALLQSFNEEMFDAPSAGEILVPMRDFTGRAGIVGERLQPRELRDAGSGAGSVAREEAPTRVLPEDARNYKVRDGDNLSGISERFYGSKHRWKEIYEANLDVLDSPDWVKPGMTLIIPGAAVEDGVK